MNIENIKANVDHPAHYGGKDNPYETIKVIEAWGLDDNFDIATAVKYLSRLGKKAGNPFLQDLMKAKFYIDHEVEKRSQTVSEDADDDIYRIFDDMYELSKRPENIRNDAAKGTKKTKKASSCDFCDSDCVHDNTSHHSDKNDADNLPPSVVDAIFEISDYFLDSGDVYLDFENGSLVISPLDSLEDDEDDYDDYGYFDEAGALS